MGLGCLLLTQLPDPVYWVTPRHLAGDDDALAERIGDTLAGLGWRMWPTARHTLLYVSPDGLCGAEWILAAYPFELGGGFGVLAAVIGMGAVVAVVRRRSVPAPVGEGRAS